LATLDKIFNESLQKNSGAAVRKKKKEKRNMSGKGKRKQSDVMGTIPIVFGSSATPLPENDAPDSHTHKWSVYLKSPTGQDLTKFFKKVVIKLHESFQHPNRSMTQEPYHVAESGWGEFEIQIKLHLIDPQESVITLFHFLKLYEDEGTEIKPGTETTLIAETYDEIVFPKPSPLMAGLLKDFAPSDSKRQGVVKDYNAEEAKQLQLIKVALDKVDAKQSEVSKKAATVDAEFLELQQQVDGPFGAANVPGGAAGAAAAGGAAAGAAVAGGAAAGGAAAGGAAAGGAAA